MTFSPRSPTASIRIGKTVPVHQSSPAHAWNMPSPGGMPTALANRAICAFTRPLALPFWLNPVTSIVEASLTISHFAMQPLEPPNADSRCVSSPGGPARQKYSRMAVGAVGNKFSTVEPSGGATQISHWCFPGRAGPESPGLGPGLGGLGSGRTSGPNRPSSLRPGRVGLGPRPRSILAVIVTNIWLKFEETTIKAFTDTLSSVHRQFITIEI
ncbi:hypothetical protein B0H14DRAFT_2613939 [Mycena olivaceomarginata]|nr:hypothetical protein B0H14DRAFT_2613939 [Mycena olivaceomarginata]